MILPRLRARLRQHGAAFEQAFQEQSRDVIDGHRIANPDLERDFLVFERASAGALEAAEVGRREPSANCDAALAVANTDPDACHRVAH